MQRTSVKPGAVLVIVCTGVVLVTLDLFIVNLAFPSIERSFGGASLSSLSWVLNAFTLAFGIIGALVATPAAAFFSAFYSEFYIKRRRAPAQP